MPSCHEDRGPLNQILNTRGDIAATARAALRRATSVRLNFDLTDSEGAQAKELYPNEEVTASIAETLVGAQALLDKYHAGRIDQLA